MIVTARRLLWGKFCNAGQTCVAPDYVLCAKDVQVRNKMLEPIFVRTNTHDLNCNHYKEKLLPVMEKVLKEFFGENPKDSKSFGRIINDRHFQ